MGLLPLNPRETLLPLELEEALELRKPVRMEYLDAQEQRTERVVEPLQVRRRSGELMLVAHCHLRNARRTFKLERIVQLRRIEPTAAVVSVELPVPASPEALLFEPNGAHSAPLEPIVSDEAPLAPLIPEFNPAQTSPGTAPQAPEDLQSPALP
jgi:hypothetical protein